MRIFISKHGRTHFINLLEESGVPFNERLPPVGVIRAASEILEITGLIAATATPLALVLKAWMKANASRKIILQTTQGVIHTEGMSAEDTVKFLKTASSLTLIQPKSDENDAA